MKIRIKALHAALLGVAAAISARAQSATTEPAANPSAGEAASAPVSAPADEIANFPPFSRQTVTGQPFDSGAHYGRPLLIVFWASWCAACIEEAPALRALKARYGDRLRMTGIAAKEGESESEVRAKARALRFNYPIIYDHDDSLRASFNVKLIPQLLLIGGDGRFLLRTMDLDTILRKLAELLPTAPHTNPRAPSRAIPRGARAKIRAPSPRN